MNRTCSLSAAPRWPRSSTRGSMLILALIIAAVIGISLASYLRLGKSTLTISNRALYNNAAMNLAENGLEEAMYSVNRFLADPDYSWTADGWTAQGSADMRRKWTSATDSSLLFDQNATGEVRVYVINYGNSPRILVRGLVTLAGAEAGAPIEKWVEVQLRRTSKFANGLVAKDTIRFAGNNASVDSWNSSYNPDGTPRATPVAYSASTRLDNGSVGSISVAVDSVLVQNADIWGYASTGGALPSVGSNGLVGPFGTPSGTMDMNRVATDFSANFDPVTAPTTTNYSLGTINTNLDLPRVGDSPASDGVFYYEASQLVLNGNEVFNVKRRASDTAAPKVVLKLTNTSTSVQMTGNTNLNIESGATFEIYAPGDVTLAGNGVMNGGTTSGTANLPSSFQIWGTRTTGTQSIQFAGNGVFSGIVYAPQGSVKINGNGDVLGSVVANDITVVGNAAFHYDEALSRMDGNNPFRVTRWNELTTATDRAAYATHLTF